MNPSQLRRRYANGETRLLRALGAGNGAEVDALLAAGVDTRECNPRRETAVFVLCRGANALRCTLDVPRLLQVFLDAGVDVNTPTLKTHGRVDQTPLHEAAKRIKNAAPLVRLLLDAGADPGLRNDDGRLPVEEATYGVVCGGWRSPADQETLKRFLAVSGRALAIPRMDVHTAIAETVGYIFQESKFTDAERRARAEDWLVRLMAAGANPNGSHDRSLWRTPVGLAVRDAGHHPGAQERVLKILLQGGADADPPLEHGYLHALLGQNPQRLRGTDLRAALLLIAAGADVRRQDEQGRTVLDRLAEKRQTDLIEEALGAAALKRALPDAAVGRRPRM